MDETAYTGATPHCSSRADGNSSCMPCELSSASYIGDVPQSLAQLASNGTGGLLAVVGIVFFIDRARAELVAAENLAIRQAQIP